MKLISYWDGGTARFGVVDGDGVIDATEKLGARFAGLREVIEAGALDQLEVLADGGGEARPLDEIDFLLPIPNPRKIFCIGRNYGQYHEVVEDGGAPEFPSVFGRYVNSFVAHDGTILKPRVSDQLDYENELGVIIGRRARHVDEANAMSCIAGYTVVNEGSVRDWQRKGTQNTPGKNFYRSGSIGPWMVTADEIPSLDGIRIVTRRNGEMVQDGTTDTMLCKIPYLIAHISTFTELEPGDLIATGSPGGSVIESPDPKPWLKAGDELEFEIAGVGVLNNRVENE